MAKIKYGIKNVHIAVRTESDEGVTYATPIAFPGAKSISLDAQGDISKFYADDILYYQTAANNGYEGDLEVALFTDEVRKAILSEVEDTKKVLFEDANATSKSFALLFEISTDTKGYRFCFYNCAITRPSVASDTKEETTDPGTDTATISCAPNPDGLVRAKTTESTDETVYNNWYKTVYQKNEAA